MFAWIIGWDLILEYAFGAATVASGWSGYLLSFLQDWGITIPPQFTSAHGEPLVLYNSHWEHLARIKDSLASAGIDPASLPHKTAYFDALPSWPFSPSQRCWSSASRNPPISIPPS